MNTKIRVAIVVGCFLLFLPVMAIGQDKDLDKTLYVYGKYADSWKKVTYFNGIIISGNEHYSKNFSTNNTTIKNYLRLQLKNNFATIPFINPQKFVDLFEMISKKAGQIADETMAKLHPDLKKGTLEYILTSSSIQKNENKKLKEKNHIGGKNVFFFIFIETIGEDYPVAFHISFNAGEKEIDEYENTAIGICKKNDLPEQLKKCIKSLGEDFAITFFKIRGEL